MQNVIHPIPVDGDSRIRPFARTCAARIFATLALLISIFMSMSLAQARPADSEIYALENIGISLNAYTTTGAFVWFNHHGWSANTPPDDPCEGAWFGVLCDAGNHHIVGIVMTNNNVHGTLPDATVWADLPLLNDISLNNDFISGSIPDLSVLPNLLDFSVIGDTDAFGQFPTYLTGSIPSLAALTQLQTLRVGSNHLTGTIPDLSTLTNLQIIDVSSNQLTGSIPDLTHNTQLNLVSFRNNSLTGSLPALAQMTELFRFDAGSNYLTGNIPPIVSLPYLNRFYINNNQLTGPMPDIHNMPAMNDLDLSYNQLSGPMECLGVGAPCNSGLSQLVAIDVSHNLLGGPFPTLDGLGSLQYFRVSYNSITGPIKAMPAQQQQMISEVCPNPMNLTPQPGIDEYWPSTIQGNPNPWWGPAGAYNSCDLILRAEFD